MALEKRSSMAVLDVPCALCDGEVVRLEIGGTEKLALVGDNTGRFVSRDAQVALESAHVCTACGHAQLFADPEKIRQRILSRFSNR